MLPCNLAWPSSSSPCPLPGPWSPAVSPEPLVSLWGAVELGSMHQAAERVPSCGHGRAWGEEKSKAVTPSVITTTSLLWVGGWMELYMETLLPLQISVFFLRFFLVAFSVLLCVSLLPLFCYLWSPAYISWKFLCSGAGVDPWGHNNKICAWWEEKERYLQHSMCE